jgi:DNA-binding PadR family transcriptional regulator
LWRVEEARPRRYYVVSAEGRKVLPLLKEEWDKLAVTMQGFLSE